MRKHEAHCTMNPDRECNVCKLVDAEQGPMGTPPAELVRIVLERKDAEIRMLKQGFVSI